MENICDDCKMKKHLEYDPELLLTTVIYGSIYCQLRILFFYDIESLSLVEICYYKENEREGETQDTHIQQECE